jgi:hypothetical protein
VGTIVAKSTIAKKLRESESGWAEEGGRDVKRDRRERNADLKPEEMIPSLLCEEESEAPIEEKKNSERDFNICQCRSKIL